MERKGWKELPPTLLLGVALHVGLSVLSIVLALKSTRPWERGASFALAEQGAWVAAQLLMAAGVGELARSLGGRARVLVRTAAVMLATLIAVDFAWTWVWPHVHGDSIETVETIHRWSWWVVRAAPALLLAGATWNVRRTVAVPALIASVIANLPPPVAKHAFGWAVHGIASDAIVRNALDVITLGAIVALAAAHLGAARAAEPVVAAAGMRRVASGLWLRVVGICVLLGLTLLVAMGRADESSIGMLKFAMISSAVLTVISLVQLTLGVLATVRAGVIELPRATLVLSASLLLWCLGVLAAQLQPVYQMLYGHDGYGGFGHMEQDMATALATTTPVLATLGVALVAAAIAQFARERSDEDLREDATAKGVGFVALMLVSVAIPAWFLPKAQTTSSLFLMSLCAIVAGIWATVLMARLCTQASLAIEREPGLPAATIVNAP